MDELRVWIRRRPPRASKEKRNVSACADVMTMPGPTGVFILLPSTRRTRFAAPLLFFVMRRLFLFHSKIQNLSRRSAAKTDQSVKSVQSVQSVVPFTTPEINLRCLGIGQILPEATKLTENTATRLSYNPEPFLQKKFCAANGVGQPTKNTAELLESGDNETVLKDLGMAKMLRCRVRWCGDWQQGVCERGVCERAGTFHGEAQGWREEAAGKRQAGGRLVMERAGFAGVHWVIPESRPLKRWKGGDECSHLESFHPESIRSGRAFQYPVLDTGGRTWQHALARQNSGYATRRSAGLRIAGETPSMPPCPALLPAPTCSFSRSVSSGWRSPGFMASRPQDP
jgi:hypothetical protein